MTTTKAILDLQTDLKQPNVPTAADDVASKDYVDSVAGGAADATSGSGGGTKGIATFDSDLGLEITGGPLAVASVKLDATRGTAFNGSGEIQAKVSATEGVEFNGSGEIAVKLSATAAEQGLEFNGSGELKAKVDNTSIQINAGTGELEVLAAAVPLATAGSADTGTLGRTRANSDEGLDINGSGTMSVKVDNSTIQFNVSGELESIGGGAINSGDVAHRIGFTRNITAVTAPTSGSTGVEIDTLDHPDGSTTGQRFEFTVPDDYFQGPLQLLTVYRMSTAVAAPNNQVRVTTQAEIAINGGTVDTVSYPETGQNLTVPDNSTDITRVVLLNISQGDFAAGDTVNFFVKRIGADAADLHTGDWRVISYECRYESIIDQRVAISRIEFLAAAGANPAATPGTLPGSVEIDTLNFLTGVDNAQKFAFSVPDHWDQISEASILVTYAMSSAAAATVRLTADHEIADVSGGSIITIPTQTNDLAVPSTTDNLRTVAFQIDPANLAPGSDITTVFQRLGSDVADTHGGDFQLISVSAIFSIAPSSGFTAVTVLEDYLRTPNFGNVVGVVTADIDYPLFGTTFDTFAAMTSTAAASRVDCSFHGRLSGPQTQIGQLRINIFGAGASPEYRLLVYAEGSGAVPVFDSGVLPAPGAPTETVVLAGGLSAQPVGQKRFAVVVEAYIDAGEEVRCSFPFVRQE